MGKSGKTLQFGAIIVVVATALLLIALVAGAIDTEQLKTTFGKTVLIVGVLVLSSIGILAIVASDDKK
ncbi:MAG: hypothetical protein V4702_02805 [Patescibacteria group bacterium]